MKNLVVITVSILMLMGCEKSPSQLVNIEQVLIGSGNLYGNGGEGIQKGNLIINNETVWKDLLTKIDSKNNESQNFIETEIDFNNFIVLAIFDEVKGSGGYSIKIEQLKETNSSIEAFIRRESPTEISATVMTQPFYISKILRNSKTIVFKE